MPAFLEVAFAARMTAIAINLDAVFGALAVNAAKLLALLGDGACTWRIRALFVVPLVGHLASPPGWVDSSSKTRKLLVEIAGRVK